MERRNVDRRRGRRIALEAPIRIRGIEGAQKAEFQDETSSNVSLAGLYFETERSVPFSRNDEVVASVAIPGPKTRDFPFTRLSGRGRIVRVEKLEPSAPGEKARHGVAVEFGQDLTALSAIPTR